MRKALLILALVTLYSCSDSNHYNTTSNYSDSLAETDSITGATQEFSLSCEYGQNCPEYVSHIRVNNKSACTGVLIEENKVLTNAHCLAGYREKEACSGISLYFQKDGTTYKRTCSKVLKKGMDSSDKSANFNDYAILKFETEISLDTASLSSQNNLQENENVTVYATDVTGTNSAQIQTRENCQNLGTTAISKSRDLWFFKNCDIRPGNSGSPIINYNGDLVGLINMSLSQNKISLLSSGISMSNLSYNNYGAGFNIDCINDAQFLQKSCSISEAIKKEKIKDLFRQTANHVELLNDRLADPYIIWNLDIDKLRPTPVCIKNAEALAVHIKDETSKFDYYVQGKREYEYNISFTDFVLRKEIDSNLRLKIKLRNRNSLVFNYMKLDMQDYEDTGLIELKLNGSLAGIIPDTYKLRRCNFTVDDLAEEFRSR